MKKSVWTGNWSLVLISALGSPVKASYQLRSEALSVFLFPSLRSRSLSCVSTAPLSRPNVSHRLLSNFLSSCRRSNPFWFSLARFFFFRLRLLHSGTTSPRCWRHPGTSPEAIEREPKPCVCLCVLMSCVSPFGCVFWCRRALKLRARGLSESRRAGIMGNERKLNMKTVVRALAHTDIKQTKVSKVKRAWEIHKGQTTSVRRKIIFLLFDM